MVIRATLVATFVAVVIADLAECQPFNHYWQVLPDPGGQCRQGYAQLITMATCNILTDLLLVLYPVPIILTSYMGTKKKIQLTVLFSSSLIVVGATGYRIPRIIGQDGNQQIRSLLASVELLLATAVANMLVLGSFVRDRGLKKTRYRHTSIAADSMDRASDRRPTLHRHWGSDEDLVRDLGLGVDRELRDAVEQQKQAEKPARPFANMDKWDVPRRNPSDATRSDASILVSGSRSSSTLMARRVSFIDAGGLLDSDRSRSALDTYGSILEPPSPPSTAIQAAPSGFRRGSQVLLQDLSGLLSPFNSRQPRSSSRNRTELVPIPQQPEHITGDSSTSHGNSADTEFDLKDLEAPFQKPQR